MCQCVLYVRIKINFKFCENNFFYQVLHFPFISVHISVRLACLWEFMIFVVATNEILSRIPFQQLFCLLLFWFGKSRITSKANFFLSKFLSSLSLIRIFWFHCHHFQVVCGLCSDCKAPLRYLMYKPARVCQECFDKLSTGKRRPLTRERPFDLLSRG